MTLSARRIILSAVVVVGIGLIVLAMLRPSPTAKLPSHPLYEDLKRVRKALFMYERDQGHFPYSDHGARSALYRLKPYFGEMLGAFAEQKWNAEKQELIVDGLFYANEPPQTGDDARQAQDVLLSIRVDDKGTFCLLRNGLIFCQQDHR